MKQEESWQWTEHFSLLLCGCALLALWALLKGMCVCGLGIYSWAVDGLYNEDNMLQCRFYEALLYYSRLINRLCTVEELFDGILNACVVFSLWLGYFLSSTLCNPEYMLFNACMALCMASWLNIYIEVIAWHNLLAQLLNSFADLYCQKLIRVLAQRR